MNPKKLKRKPIRRRNKLDTPTLKSVVLYNTGVGFYRKHGKINLTKEKKVSIPFPSKNLNDLLKSFSIHQLKGKFAIGGISYESGGTSPSKMLEDSMINISAIDTLIQLFHQLRGVQIQISTYTGEIEGTVVGTQNRKESVGEQSTGVIDKCYLLMFDTDENLKTILLDEIQSVKILDQVAKQDFRFFMDVMKSGKKEKFRNLAIFFQGKGTAEYAISFLVECPAWKVSYRLFLKEPNPEEGETSSDDKMSEERELLLQSWAIIDNVLDENWEGVNLKLISGLPISFIYDSYSPLWISRPHVQRSQELTLKNTNSSVPTRTEASSALFGSISEAPSPKIERNKTKTLVQKVVGGTASKGVGFQYDIKVPVNVKRNQSSLIPLLQEEIKGTMLSVYNEGLHSVNPMSALAISNTTGFVLESGPISIFSDEIFEGEAVLPYLNKVEKYRIPYSLDQSIEIHKEFTSKTLKIHKVVVKRDLTQFYFQEDTITYKINNLTGDKKTLILEHPKNQGFTLFESAEIFEDSKSFFRFRINLGGEKSTTFIVKQRRVLSQRKNAATMTRLLLDDWKRAKFISNSEYKLLNQILDLQEEIVKIQQDLQSIENRHSVYYREHERIRKNIDVLKDIPSDRKLRNRYVEKFEIQETEIDLLLDKKVKLTKQKKTLETKQRDLREMLAGNV